ncbi:MAG: LysM peptidoglycan-binding domain-containing protein [Methylacidiphilales bacterium]|nr:LysM peptidoglycan-binding domain-containing protein [Candidatus Methylacidiphilales bacterium]
MNEGMNNNPSSPKTAASPMLSKVFLWVLAAHIVVIVCFCAYHLLRGNSEKKTSPETAVTENAQDAASTAPSAPAAPAEQPTVETDQPANQQAAAAPVHSPQETGANGMSMPSTSDPIWNNAAQEPPAVPPGKAQKHVQAANTVEQTARTEAPAPATEGSGSYTVQKGDSLSKIAKKHGVTVASLKTGNNLSSDHLKIGQVLNIPGASASSASAPTEAAAKGTTEHVARAAVANSTVGYKSYKVAKGDTLWKIAKNFKAKPAEIAKLNGISDPSKLKVGMRIKVPAAAGRETASPVEQPARTVIQNTDVAMIPAKKD